MKPIFDIFPKQRERKIKKIIKQKITADYREKNSLVASELIGLGIDIEFKNLKVADYLVGETAIERKTVSDFISSMINRRLINQLEEIQQYEKKLLIIEGIEEQELYNDYPEGMNGNAIRGFILTILLKFKIPIIFSKNEEDTAKFMSVLLRKKSKELSLNPKKKSMNKKERLQYIIEGFPGIGPKTAKKLLKKFKTIENIVNAPLEEIKKEIGKKAEVLKKLIEQEY